MNGKILKVAQYNLEFGARDRFVNVFGCFKYKPNGNIYVIYADVDTKYPIIYYGGAHVKNNNILSMQCKDMSEQELIKEYVYKVTNDEVLENFEMLSLDSIETIELIGSNKIEVKPEIIITMEEKTIKKVDEVKEEVKVKKSSKKKNGKSKFLLILLLIILIAILIGLVYIKVLNTNNTNIKEIVCEKEYEHNVLVVSVLEKNVYKFNNFDSLEEIKTITTYKFDEESYRSFIVRGTYYKYLPEDNKLEGYKQDDDKYTFEVISNDIVSASYNKPTSYEEVLSYNKSEGYTCIERIEQ